MKKFKAFTFVELLLVMLILGIIISLTLPIIKGIKDDDDIYRAYMKKANQDVTDAMNMIFIKENQLRDISMWAEGLPESYIGASKYPNNAAGLRNLFNSGLGGLKCGECTDNLPGGGGLDPSKCAVEPVHKYLSQCLIQDNQNRYDFKVNNIKAGLDANNTPGLLIGGKPVLIFQMNEYVAANQVKCSYDNTGKGDDEKIFACVFVDMNKEKSPNEFCKDRYKFIIYNDRIAMETDPAKGGCDFSLGN